ncbi:MAG: autotransporter-associated beta strand repeat-containing protein, partial [Chthoniobacterales bacterium]
MTLSASNTYTGLTSIHEGALRLADGGSLDGDVFNGASLVFGQSGALRFAGIISGGGSLVQAGAGTTTLAATNAYTGTTVVSNGTLRAGSSRAFGSQSAASVASGAVLDLAGYNNSLGSLAGNGSVMIGGATLSVGDGNSGSTFAGVISGSNGSLVKLGTGTMTLSGANTYTGGTTVEAGVLAGDAVSLQGAIVNRSDVLFNQTNGGTYAGSMSGTGRLRKEGAGTLTLAGTNTHTGGTLVDGGALAGDTTSLQGNITAAANTLVIFSQTVNGAYLGDLTGSGNFRKEGAGTLVLAGANTLGGLNAVSGGVLQIGSVSALSSNSSLALADASGAALDLGGFDLTLGTLSGGGTNGGGVRLGTNTLSLGTRGEDMAFGGEFSGSGGIIKLGTGTLTLSGENTYTGSTVVAAGTLRAGSVTAFGTNSAASVASGALLDVNGQSLVLGSLTGAGTVSLGSASLTVGTLGVDTTFSGVINGTGSLLKEGAGIFTLTGSNSYTGGTFVSGGTLVGDAGSLQGDISNDALLVFDQAVNGLFTGTIFGSGGLNKIGAGTLTINRSSLSYTGLTTIAQGRLILLLDPPVSVAPVAAFSAFSSTVPAVLISGELTLDDLGGGISYADELYGVGSVLKTGLGTVTLTGSNSYSGGTTVNQGTLAGNTTSLQGNFTLASNNTALSFLTTNTETFGGTVGGLGALRLDGSGTLVLDRANTHAGGTRVAGGGMLVTKSGSALGTGDVAIVDGTLAPDGASSLVIGGNLSFSGSNAAYLWTLSSASKDNPGANFTAPIALGGDLVVTNGSSLDLYFAPTVDPADRFWSRNRTNSWALIEGGTNSVLTSGTNFTLAWASATDTNISSRFSLTNFSLAVRGNSLFLDYYRLVTFNWATNNGAWTNRMSWVDGFTPSRDDNAFIDNGGTATLSGAGAADTLLVGSNTAGNTLIVSNTGTLLDAGEIVAGASATSTNNSILVTSGGDIQTARSIILGTNGGNATLTLAGGNVRAGQAVAVSSGSTLAGGGFLTASNVAVSGTLDPGVTDTLRIESDLDFASGSTFNWTLLSNSTGGAGTNFSSPVDLAGNLSVSTNASITLFFGTGVDAYDSPLWINGRTNSWTLFRGTNSMSAGTNFTLAWAAGSNTNGFSLTDGTFFLTATNDSLLLNYYRLITYNWATNSGFWNNRTNWSSGIVPGAGVTATIDNGGTAIINGTNASLLSLVLGETNGGSNTLVLMNGGVLTADSIQAAVQPGSSATINVGRFGMNDAGGTIVASNGISFGDGTGRINFNQSDSVLFSAAIEGAITLSHLGTGSTVLSGMNIYTGPTVVSNGALRAGSSSAFGFQSAASVATGAVLDLDGYNTSLGSLAGNGSVMIGGATLSVGDGNSGSAFSGVISGSNGALVKLGTGTMTLSGANSYTGGTTVEDGTLAGDAVSLQGEIVNRSDVLFNQTNGGTYAGLMSGAGRLRKEGAGTLTLAGANSYAGGTLVDGGALEGDTTSLQGDITAAANTLVIFSQTGSGAYAGSMSGAGTMVKQGRGTLTLTGVNTHTGGTAVVAGMLLLNGTNSGNGAISVNGGTFGGTGSAVNSAVTVASGGNITPGAGSSSGTLSIGDLTLNTGSTLNIFLGSTTSSLLAVNGNAALGGTLHFSTNTTLTASLYTFLSYTGTNTGSFASISNAPGNYSIVTNSTGGTNFLSLQRFAELGPIVASFGAGTNAVITGGSVNFSVLVTNEAPVGSQDLVFTGTNGGNTAGSIGSTTVTAGSSVAVSGMSFTGTNVGAGQTGTFTVDAPDARPQSGTGTVTVDVYDHALGTLLTTNVTLQAVHAGYTNLQTSLIGMSNSAGFRAAMLTAATNSSNNLTLGAVSNVVAGSTGNAILTFGTNQGVGAFTNVIGVVFGDDSTLAGASAQVGTNFLTVTGLVYSGQSTWTAGSGNWTNFANWTALGGTPGLDGALSINDSATFGSGSGGIVTLDTNAALNALTFSNASASYQIGGGGMITLQAGNNAPTIDNHAGSHTITSYLNLADNVTVNNAGGTILTLGNKVMNASNSTVTLTQAGTGTLVLSGSSANLYLLLAANSGTTVLSKSSGSAVYGISSLAAGATVLYGGNNQIMSGNGVSTNFGKVRMTGGTLDLNGYSDTINAITDGTGAYGSVGMGTITSSTGLGTLTIGNVAGTIRSSVFGGVITGSLSLVLNNTNTLTLTGSNSYTGGTLVNAGTLIGDSTSLQGTITNSSTVVFSDASSGTYAGIMSGTGAMIMNGAGTLILTGNNTYSGRTVITNGTLQVGDGGAAGSLGTASVINDGSLLFNRSNSLTVGNGISGSGSVAQIGSGTTILSGSNSHSGGTLVSAGVLQAGSADALGTGTVTIAGSAANQATLSSLLSGTNITLGGPLFIGGYATIAIADANSIFSGLSDITISGNGNYIDFSGIVGLNSTNTLLSGTNITGNSISLTGLGVGGGTLSLGGSFTSGHNNFTFTNTGTQLQVISSVVSLDLAFNGSSGNWDTNSSNTTWNTYPNGPTNQYFLTGDNVWFTNNATVTVDAGGVAAGSLTFTNDTGTLVSLGGGNITASSLNNAANGNVVISNTVTLGGAQLLSVGGGTLTLAGSDSTAGMLTIDRGTTIVTGSVLAGGDLTAGSSNGGVMMLITNGGSVAGSNGWIGSNSASSNNRVVVSGINSLWISSADLYVGNQGSSNSLVISDGGGVVNTNGSIGFETISSNNIVTVTGAGSVWSNSSQLRVGYQGSGNSLVISNGGSVYNGDGIVGYLPQSSSNMVLVTGPGSKWSNSSNLYVGNEGSSNSLVISNEGTVANRDGYIGVNGTSSNNSVLVTGSNSLWTNSGNLHVGNDGSSNSLVISNRATVANGAGYIGNTTNSSNNSVLVTGSNSLWTNSGNLHVGNDGSSNSLVISNRGMVANGAGYIGNTTNSSNNSVLVTSNSLWTNSSQLYVGNYGSSNSLVISNGGTVWSFIGHIGNDSVSSNNSVLVKGGNSLWTNSFRLYVGLSGSGNSLEISNEGTVANIEGYIGYYAVSSNNSVLVTSNSLWTNSGELAVGYEGSGNSLVISNGGMVANGAGNIGFYAVSSNNSVLVTGSNSLWTSAGDLVVGRAGSGNTLVISNRSTVANVDGFIGFGATSSNNSVLVTSNSLWTNSGGMNVGFTGSGNNLVMSNGGRVANGFGTIGFLAESSNNSVQVTGNNSTWTNSNELNVGLSGSSNSLVISDGGMVANGGGIIGNASTSSNNSVLVTGSDSLWSNSGALTVGYAGAGSLTVANGATVTASGITIASQSGSAGTLNIGSLGGADSAGTIAAATISFGSGMGILNFNQINSVTITNVIAGPGNGVINQFGSGTTILTGNNSGFSGLTTITNGTLQIGDGVAAGASVSTGNFTNDSLLSFVPTATDTYTLSGNISGSGSITQRGNGTLILSGNNTYTGTTLISAGTLQLNGTNSAGDISVSGGTLSGTGSATGSAVTVGSGAVIAPGSGSSIGTLSIGSLTLNGGTLNILLDANSCSLLDVNGFSDLGGGLHFSTNAVLNASTYIFLTNSGASFTNTFASVSNLPTGYQLVYGGKSVYLQLISQLGPVSTSFAGTNAVITGGSTNFTVTVTNSAPVGSDNLVFTGTSGTNVSGSLGSTTVAPQSSASFSNLFAFVGTNVGAGQQGAVTINSTNSIPLTATGTVSVDVYNHAEGSISTNAVDLGSAIVGYTSLSNSLMVSNATGFRVALKTTNDAGGDLSVGNVTNIAPNAASNIMVTYSGQGTGTHVSPVTVTFADDSSLSGAGTNGTTNLSVTATIYAHASGSLTDTTLNLSEAIVGFTNAIATNLAVTNAAGFRVDLKTIASSSNSNLIVSDISRLAEGSSTNIVFTLSTNQGIGVFTNIVTVVSADDSTLPGAATNAINTVTVTGAIYDHASNILSTNSIALRAVHVGYTDAQTNLIGMSNAAGIRVAMLTEWTNSSNNISLTGVAGVSNGVSSNAILTFGTNQGVGAFTNVIGVVYGDDSRLAGASATVGTNYLTVTGLVYSGQSTWMAVDGDWADFSDWDANGGTPGLDGALSINDSATFGTNGRGEVSLVNNPELNALTFSNSSSYTIAGTGRISLVQGSNAPSITTALGSHTISNALSFTTNVIVTNASGSQVTLAGSISGSGGLTQTGSGTTILSGNNTYAGPTVLEGGTMVVNGSIINSSSVTIKTGSTLSGNGPLTTGLVNVAGGTLAPTGTTGMTISGNLNFSTSGSAYQWSLFNNTNNDPGINYSAPLVLTNGSLSVTAGLFYVNLVSPVNFTNSFWTGEGTNSWQVMSGTNVGAGTNLGIALAPGSVRGGFSANMFFLSTNATGLVLNYYLPPSITNNTGTNSIPSDNNNNVTVNGGTLDVQDPGTTRIVNLLVTGGTLSGGSNSTIAVDSFEVTGGTLSGGTYEAANYVFAPSNSATVAATLTNAGTNSWALISNSATGNAGTTVFKSAMSYTGGTLITNATLQMGNGSLTGSVVGAVTNNGVFQNGFSGTLSLTNLSTNITGNGIIAQAGTGTMTLDASALNNFTGSFAVSTNGTLAVTNTNSFGGGTNLYLANNGTLMAAAGVTNITQNINVTNGTGVIDNASGQTLALNGTLTKSGTVLVLAGGSFDVNAQITGSGASGSFNSDLVVSNATITLVASNNNYVGPTYVIAGSTLSNGIVNALPTDTLLVLGTNTDGSVTNRYSLNGFNQTIAGIASSGNALNLITNGPGPTAVLTLSGSTNTTYAGTIAGNIALSRVGAGTTTLSGNNTYSNGTTMDSGGLRIASSNALGTGQFTLAGGNLILDSLLTINTLNWSNSSSTNSIVSIDDLTAGHYINVTDTVFPISGTNYFDLTGATLSSTPVRLMFFGTNNGATTFGTNQFDIIGVSNYALSISNNSLYVALSTLPVPNGGTNVISGTNTYPSIQFGTNSTLSIAGTGNLTIQTNVTVSNNSTLNLNGIMTVSNTLTISPGSAMTGAGTLTGNLTNNGTVSMSGMTINGGVNNSGFLGGTGTINGNLVNGGVLTPGNPTGTLTVNGNFTQSATGLFVLQPTGSTTSNTLDATGGITLAGTLLVSPANGYALQFGDKYNFLSAAGGISGAFSSIDMPSGYRGRFLLTNNNTQGSLLVAPQSYTQLAANRNQSNVATALNSFIPYTSGDQMVVSTSLDSLTASQYNQAFNAIMPTFYQQIATIAFNNANAQNMQLVQRLWGVRMAEGGGFSMSGLSDNMPLLEGQGDGNSVMDPSKDILRPGLDNHWGMFVDINGIFANANSGNMLPGYNSQSGGVTT